MHRFRGFLAVGYHYVIRRDGTLEHGRPFMTQGAHVKGFNDQSMGICMIGGVDEDGEPENNFTQEQYLTLKTCLKTLEHVNPDVIIQGHRDFPDVLKECPCFDVKRWWDVVNQ